MAMSSFSRTIAISTIMVAISSITATCLSVVTYLIAKFEPTVEFAVAEVCRVGHSLKTGVYSFAVKVSGKAVSACDGFVSIRRSLDASALA